MRLYIAPNNRPEERLLRKNSECASRRGHGIKHGKVLAERRQREADRRYWGNKLALLESDIQTAPAGIRESYRVVARRLEPVALVYLWPRRNA